MDALGYIPLIMLVLPNHFWCSFPQDTNYGTAIKVHLGAQPGWKKTQSKTKGKVAHSPSAWVRWDWRLDWGRGPWQSAGCGSARWSCSGWWDPLLPPPSATGPGLCRMTASGSGGQCAPVRKPSSRMVVGSPNSKQQFVTLNTLKVLYQFHTASQNYK